MTLCGRKRHDMSNPFNVRPAKGSRPRRCLPCFRALLMNRNHGISLDDALALLDRPLLCAYCGNCEGTTVDHVVPPARGGSNRLENLVWACKPCNSSKRNRLLAEWVGGSCSGCGGTRPIPPNPSRARSHADDGMVELIY